MNFDQNGNPSVSLEDPLDQKFVWVIPFGSCNQLALKAYNQSHYLYFRMDDRKASLHEGDVSDQPNNNIFRRIIFKD